MDNFQFVFELNRATTALNSYIDARIVPHAGITRAQFVVLLLVATFPGITKAELARKLNSSHVAAGRLVEVVVSRGYVATVPSKQNAHIVELAITHSGEAMIKHVKTGFGQVSAGLFAQANVTVDIAELTAQLRAFADILSSTKNEE